MIKPKTKSGKYLTVLNLALSFLLLAYSLPLRLFAQDEAGKKEPVVITQDEPVSAEPQAANAEEPAGAEPQAANAEAQAASVETLADTQNVTLDFKDADIRNVLKIISYKSGVNIVTTPEVMGNVTIRLVDVPWEKALEVILKTYGFGYDRVGNIITVAPLDKLTTLKQQEVALAQVQPTITEVFNLKYIDAQDAKKALDPQLSPRGKITVLEMTGQAGWGWKASAKLQRAARETISRSKVLIISDIPPVLDKLKEVVAQLDKMPPQILVETRLMEVSRDKLKDIGFDWGTGISGASDTSASLTNSLVTAGKVAGAPVSQIGAHVLSDQIIPTVFGAKESTLTTSNTGLKLLFQKLTGTQFEAILHALDEDVNTNILSAPRIMALNNQEASILIGTKYPILTSELSTESSGQTLSVSLDHYEDIGIQLNVVPQVGADNYINMVVHPAVSSYAGTDTAITSAKYPVIDVREAETRVLMRDGETIVIGGLLRDAKNKEIIGVPFLSKIPILGLAFRRETVDTQKIDLLIFITAHIVREGEFSPEEIKKIEDTLNRGIKETAVRKKKE